MPSETTDRLNVLSYAGPSSNNWGPLLVSGRRRLRPVVIIGLALAILAIPGNFILAQATSELYRIDLAVGFELLPVPGHNPHPPHVPRPLTATEQAATATLIAENYFSIVLSCYYVIAAVSFFLDSPKALRRLRRFACIKCIASGIAILICLVLIVDWGSQYYCGGLPVLCLFAGVAGTFPMNLLRETRLPEVQAYYAEFLTASPPTAIGNKDRLKKRLDRRLLCGVCVVFFGIPLNATVIAKVWDILHGRATFEHGSYPSDWPLEFTPGAAAILLLMTSSLSILNCACFLVGAAAYQAKSKSAYEILVSFCHTKLALVGIGAFLCLELVGYDQSWIFDRSVVFAAMCLLDGFYPIYLLSLLDRQEVEWQLLYIGNDRGVTSILNPFEGISQQINKPGP